MSLITRLNITAESKQSGSADLATQDFPLKYANIFNLADGTGANQADLLFSDTRTLGASANEDLDLSGVLTDAFGATLTFAKIKAIFIKAATGNTNDVEVKPAAANGFIGPFNAAADTLKVPAGGMIALLAPVTGWTVTAATADLLNIANGGAGTGVDYDVVIIGTSA